MPELPEVETIVRDLNKSLPGKIFSDVAINDTLMIRPAGVLGKKSPRQEPSDFIRRIKGQKIDKIARRGKAVLFYLASGEVLVIQLMMTGQLIVNGAPDKHTRVSFTFSDGSKLIYNDQRRFGRLCVVADLQELSHFNVLGPEPFSKEFTPALMREAFQRSNRPVKNLLLDHGFVAGIGNIYACEILFRSRLDPQRRASRVSPAQIQTVHRSIKEVLAEAITHRGSSMRNYRDASGQKGNFNGRLAVYARQGKPCLICGRPIQRVTQAGRSTFYCKECQK